ncbi:hypothetical protein ACFTAO_50315 [Paenibacillus rhizoplanae]
MLVDFPHDLIRVTVVPVVIHGDDARFVEALKLREFIQQILGEGSNSAFSRQAGGQENNVFLLRLLWFIIESLPIDYRTFWGQKENKEGFIFRG